MPAAKIPSDQSRRRSLPPTGALNASNGPRGRRLPAVVDSEYCGRWQPESVQRGIVIRPVFSLPSPAIIEEISVLGAPTRAIHESSLDALPLTDFKVIEELLLSRNIPVFPVNRVRSHSCCPRFVYSAYLLSRCWRSC